MNYKSIILIILFFFGGIFQNCNHCDFNESIIPHYFDIKGIKVDQYKVRNDCCGSELIKENENVNRSNYSFIQIQFNVDYIVEIKPQKSYFRMNSLYACSPISPGEKGSKNERLKEITVITLSDFNSNFFANDTINKMLIVKDKNIDLDDYLTQKQSLIEHETLSLGFKRGIEYQPDFIENFKLKIILELSTGEIYVAESIPFNLR